MAVGRRLFISGTASIAPDGSSAYPDDPAGQVACTMEAVAAVAAQAGGRLEDALRGIVYWHDARCLPLFAAWCRAHGLTTLPAVTAAADICRSELIFEVELELLLPETRA